MRTVFRKEIKYVISRVEFLRLTKHLDVLMQRDTNGVNGTYIVRSQYYDSLGDRDLYDNLDGVMEKRKIRVRIYSPDDQYAKLEYKCKSNTDGKKYSLTITREETLLMEKRQYGFLLDYEEPLAKTLYVKLMQGGYMPKTIVEYKRTAYMHTVSDVRVTFDTDIRAGVVPYGIFAENLAYIPLIEGDRGVLEVKYNDFVPSTLKQIIQEINSLPEASSKYSKARSYI